VRETLANRLAVKRLLERTRNLGSGALSGRSLTAVLRVKSELGEAVEIALEPARRRRDPLQELNVALELPQRIAERGYRGALADDAGRHSDLMDRIRAMSNAAVEVAIRLAHHRSPYTGMEKKAANRALNELADASIVIRPDGRGSWTLADPLFSAYIRREISDA
jgi:hypothetical protein